jgi:hypothetical protein
VSAPDELHAALEAGRADLVEAGSILELTVERGDALRSDVTLAPSTAPSGEG